MSTSKKRIMYQLCLRTGEVKKDYTNVPSTIARYIRTINILNRSANVYGVVYLPDEEDADYARFVSEV